ncbi:ABC transporter ATP-binding protein [Sutcliffiella deserti]|uniref:ABC transporter ATP-binding protein n=1 Tax=Sutcliffiella deserti TaxID=2875501 RepID=UPI0037DA4E00
MGVIHIKQVTKSYGKTVVLQDVSFQIDRGEIVGLIGPSGSGKTTLVKTIIGMEQVDSGAVTVYDRLMPNREILGQIGYMAQSDSLYLELSAEQQMMFFAKLYNVPNKERKERIQTVMKLVDLHEERKKRVLNFSGGMKRRLSLAMALLQNPEFLVLDEPTVGIDPRLRKEIWEELTSLKEEGKSILVTTHVMDEAERCDRLVLLLEGGILATGSPRELKKRFNTDTIEAIFLQEKGRES